MQVWSDFCNLWFLLGRQMDLGGYGVPTEQFRHGSMFRP